MKKRVEKFFGNKDLEMGGGLQIRVGRFDSGPRLQVKGLRKQVYAGLAQLVERYLAKV